MINEVKCHREIHQNLSTEMLLINIVSIFQQRTLKQIVFSNILGSLIKKRERFIYIFLYILVIHIQADDFWKVESSFCDLVPHQPRLDFLENVLI